MERVNGAITLSLQITTPSKRYLEFGYLQTKPFYREPWFLVALAAASIVIIIMVVAILCVKSKSYKYKGERSNIVQRVIGKGGNVPIFEGLDANFKRISFALTKSSE